MLKITKKVEYALIAVRHLKETPKDLVPVSEISNLYGIPRELLAKTMQQLASKNIVKSVKGPRGGYRPTLQSSETNLNDFFEIIKIIPITIKPLLGDIFNFNGPNSSSLILLS